MFCSNCGKENLDTASFCINCGEPFADASVSKKNGTKTIIPKKHAMKKINPLVIAGIVLVALVVAVYFLFIKETPTSAGIKAAEIYYNIEKKYKEEIISGLISFNKNIAKTPRTFQYSTRVLAGNNLTYILNNPIKLDEPLKKYIEEKKIKYKDNGDELSEFQSVYENKLTEYQQKLTDLDNIIIKEKEGAYKNLNEIHPPYPDIQTVKNELMGKTILIQYSLTYWTFLNDNTKDFLIGLTHYDNNQCNYDGGFISGGGEYLCLHIRFFLQEAQTTAGVDKWVLDLQNTQIIKCESH
jgi:hypothetical protein